MNRIRSLDVIRGLAALSVFLTHLGNPFLDNAKGHQIVAGYHSFFQNFIWCNGGLHAGVIIFIVLSGFCIHMPFALGGTEIPNWIAYSKRRFFRIYPVMVFAIVAGLFSLYITSGQVSHLFQNLFENLFLISAVLPMAEPLGNGILLTVIVECLLYFVYPFGYLATKKYSWRSVLLVSFLIYGANICWLFFIHADPTWVQRNIFCFLCYWWVGAFAMQVATNNKWTRMLEYRYLLFVYLGYFLLSHLFSFKGAHYLNSFVLAILTAYFLAVLFNKEYLVRESSVSRRHKSLVQDFFARLGEKSYSLYVIHLPVLTLASYYFTKHQVVDPSFLYFGNIFVVAIFTGIFFYSIEQPFHRYAIKVSNSVFQK